MGREKSFASFAIALFAFAALFALLAGRSGAERSAEKAAESVIAL